MTFTLPELPFAKDALAPYISAETLDYHHGKHHAAYVTKLNGLIEGTEHANQDLETIIRTSSGGLFNNAAQVWNHTFYWNCLSADHDQALPADLQAALEHDFGSVDAFKEQFAASAMGNFGSGWTWLAKDADGKLSIVNTDDAENLLTTDLTALMVIDVWEHAYYIDTRNARPQYIENFWHLVNWQFVADNLKG